MGKTKSPKPLPKPPPPLATLPCLCALQAAPAAGFAASRAYSSDKPVVTDFEHATGLELKELEAAAKGVDLFDHFGFLDAVRGVLFCFCCGERGTTHTSRAHGCAD